MRHAAKRSPKPDAARATTAGRRAARTPATEQPYGPVFTLQRAVGNRTVGRLLQAKLVVNQQGDEYEREADRVAELVMRMPAGPVVGMLRGGRGIQRTCAGCASGRHLCTECADEAAEAEFVQRMAAPNSAGQAPATPDGQLTALHGGGQPLSPGGRSFFEPRFGYDFSRVRVHTGPEASRSTRALNALAYTHGRHVVFANGRYAPGTHEGRRLLAHELTHVVQQAGGNRRAAIMRQVNPERKRFLRHIRVPPEEVNRVPDADIRQTEEFRSLTDRDLVWQWGDKVTEEEAFLTCRLILKALRSGVRVDWEEDARDYLELARTLKREGGDETQFTPPVERPTQH